MKEDDERNPLDSGIQSHLKSFKGTSKLKKAAMNMLVKILDKEQIKALEEEFRKYDKDKTGLIHIKELEEALKMEDNGIPNEEVERIIAEVDYAGNKKINYTEFIAATIDVQLVLTEDRLNQLF